ncbi:MULTISPECIES: RteC domain-containing protein [Bacteroidota]|uniref:Tetracycline regulation of excision, RteC n=7 Tax=Bacteroidota TaxID=976 RepID=A0A081PGN0_9SPHI|nr:MULTISPECIES: RteC domain-containing protein [Bacteroidota]KEQ29853.1 tetracycline regulation of excision, RteC [Pedobacter antarcticus 4BY]KGO08670.1 tetracycline regulation of excision, RteC [Elizabethkingia miricola]KIO54398.1 tetracycline regulation of excision, RteC [Flavobacterium hibernum]MBD3905583.1 RteC domain-containing protein [Chryseobacterium muglaense]OXA88132.1 tetracycline regulation of excision, RteC [Flavobacterium hibernum]
MEIILSKILSEIRHKEDKISSQMIRSSDEAYQMTLFLNEMLCAIKTEVLQVGFLNEDQEVDFFKNVKPQILGKLIYYNKVFRIETTCPVSNGKIHQSYYENVLKNLKLEYKESICNEDFYRYYRAGRTDRDHTYFRLGKINYHDGLKSGVFEIDLSFSTYYDNKIAHIIANELLYTYTLTKINPEENPDTILQNLDTNKDISWTNSQNALIELIYALYASNSIAYGKIGIRKLALIFQVLFRTPLNDIHHSFHRMKTRAGSRTAFLDQLKISLEEYMDKDL